MKHHYVSTIGEVFARNYLDVRQRWNKMKLHHNHFFLVSTGSDGVPEIMGFLFFEEAEKAYFDKFVNNEENRNIVLTHLQKADFAKISIAYSNYFLTFNHTIVRILLYLSEAVVNAYRQNRVSMFNSYYQSFLDIVLFWLEKQMLELDTFKHDKNVKNYALLSADWTNSIKGGISTLNDIMASMRRQLRFDLLHIVPHYCKQKKLRAFRKSLEKMGIVVK